MLKLNKTLGVALAASLLLAGAAHAGTYQYRVAAPGVVAAPALAPPPVVSDGPATGLLSAVTSLDFGSVSVGQSASRSFHFANIGSSPATNIRAVTTLGVGLSIGSNTCGESSAVITLAPSQSCDVTVVYQPTSATAMFGTLAIGGDYSNSPSSLSVTGQGRTEAVGSLTAVSSADFGALIVNASASRSFTFRNTGNIAATGVSVDIPTTAGLSMSANTCGTTASPVSIAAGSSCAITLAYGGSTASKLTGTALNVSGNFATGSASLQLTGSVGNFDSLAPWSSTYSSVVALTAADLTFNTVTTSMNADKVIYLSNAGANGALSVGFSLSGDTSQFKILSVTRQYYGSTSNATCNSGGVVAVGAASATPCLADAKGSTYSGIRVALRYAPTTIGNHSVTVTPSTNNGTGLPGSLTFTGRGEFNAATAWSSTYSGVVALTAADLTFNTVTTNTFADKIIYLPNTGTNGALSVGFSLSGDTSQFKVVAIARQYYGGSSNATCNGGGVIATGGGLVTPCIADEKSGTYTTIRLQLRYAPTVIGSHTITVTPSTDNSSVLPVGSITLTGRGEFNPTAAWSSTYTSAVALTAADLAFNAVTVNTNVDKIIYVSNTGAYGALAAGFSLSGDTSQFKVLAITRQYYAGTSNAACNSGGAITTGGASATPCLADVPAGTYTGVRLLLRYTPTAVGNHTVTVTLSTNNGTVLPEPITFTGTGK